MTKNPTGGIPVEYFKALLKCAFEFGAIPRKQTEAAENYPLTTYQKNIGNLAKKWPHPDCAVALDCAYQAGQIAAAKAQQDHPSDDKINLSDMQHACNQLHHKAEVTGKGPVCAD